MRRLCRNKFIVTADLQQLANMKVIVSITINWIRIGASNYYVIMLQFSTYNKINYSI